MTEENDSDLTVDRLVREYVERSTTELDPSSLVQRLLNQTGEPQVSLSVPVAKSASGGNGRGTRRPFYLAWGSLTLAALVLAFLSGRHFNHQTASASTVLREVQSEHARGIDFCYRVRFDPDPRYFDPSRPLDGPSLSHLWTRGDRFWSDCEIGKIRFKVGREATGTVWISPSPKKGIRFSNELDKLPEVVAQLCRINSMSVPRLMNEVLIDFEVNAHSATDVSGAERTVIWAQLKPGRQHPLLSHALLEIDPRTNILVRLVLWTVQQGRPRGTVAFTLLERATIGDEQYELRSHLASDAVIEVQTLPPPDYQLDLPESSEEE